MQQPESAFFQYSLQPAKPKKERAIRRPENAYSVAEIADMVGITRDKVREIVTGCGAVPYIRYFRQIYILPENIDAIKLEVARRKARRLACN